MLVNEIIRESAYTQGLEGDLEALLMSVRANDIDSISTAKVAQELNKMGHSVSPSSLVSFLEGNPLVQTVTVNDISFAHVDQYSASGDENSAEENREKVASMAKSAAMKGIKK